MRTRSHQKELLDLKLYTQEEYYDCLNNLGKIGRLLGAQKAMIGHMRRFSPKTILDVGCGGGDFTVALAESFPEAQVVGSDIDSAAIEYAQDRWQSIPNLSFTVRSLFEEKRNAYDIVTSTLVCHHLSDEELLPFLRAGSEVAKQTLICNDLHRHPIAYALFALLSPFLFPNRLIRHDGLLSIKRAFLRKELEELLQEFPTKKIDWHWPFRWMVCIER